MNLTKNGKTLLKIIITALAFLTLLSCRSHSEMVELEEIDQTISGQEEHRITNPEQKKIPPLIGMIKEIEVIRGEQKYLYINLGRDRKGYVPGLYGYIYNDPEMKTRVGKCVVVEVYSRLSKLKVVELNYSIEQKGVVYVEVDPRFLIEK